MSWREKSCHSYIIGGVSIVVRPYLVLIISEIIEQPRFQMIDGYYRIYLRNYICSILAVTVLVHIFLILGTATVSYDEFIPKKSLL